MFTAAVEGETDETVVRRLALEVGLDVAAVYGKKGKPHLLTRLDGYNQAAQHSPWFVLVDLDHGCAPDLVRTHLPVPAQKMRLRVAVPQVEAWLLADPHQMARFLRISVARMPQEPDRLVNAKQTMVNLARHSRSSAVRLDVVPRDGSGRSVGPAYGSRLGEFIRDHWRPAVAQENSACLRRCLVRMSELAHA